MKRTMMTLLFGIAFSSLFSALYYMSSDHKPAKLQFIDSRIIEYGDIRQGEIAEVTVHFKNIGDDNLVIYDISKTCNCTEAIIPKKVYSSGEEGRVSIKISTAGKIGQQTIVLKMMTNGENDYYIIRVNLTVLDK